MVSNRYVVIKGSAKDKYEAIKLCANALYEKGIVSEEFANSCICREEEYPTGLPTVIPTAMPHAGDDGITESCICFLKLDHPVTFNRMDDVEEEIETSLIFNLAIKDSSQHIKFLQNMMTFLDDKECLNMCQKLEGEDLIKYFSEKIG
ncbi:PTS sugar transporter subunit IIA [Tannockella kyphosi]|uniref:PTS sugar transporter subunit IIA n=1 Tax=Tannockella kyphosi TaxID=2899121 RepID=UPI002012AB30|nr:PTS sugar transporter subunit IIA [Tannockella kyphosi]